MRNKAKYAILAAAFFCGVTEIGAAQPMREKEIVCTPEDHPGLSEVEYTKSTFKESFNGTVSFADGGKTYYTDVGERLESTNDLRRVYLEVIECQDNKYVTSRQFQIPGDGSELGGLEYNEKEKRLYVLREEGGKIQGWVYGFGQKLRYKSASMPLTPAQPQGTGEQIAVQQAEKWLSMVDSEQYGDSWNEAAAFFRSAVPKEQWIASMNAYRKPLGKKIDRKIKSHTFTTSLPGAPDGEYVVIQFETTYANKKKAIETVTPMLDADGTWKVSGYFIK